VTHLNSDIIQTALSPDTVSAGHGRKMAFAGLSIDSRTIKPDEIFFAIVGDNNDGHKYVREAFRRGAAAAVINRSRLSEFTGESTGPIFAVDDTHEALLNLAAYMRRSLHARFAAVTGSNGKTTTKEMFYAIISRRHAAYRSPGNLNNLYGLPLSLALMPEDAQYAVFELGISVPGEMTRLASVIKPDLAVITNIGPTHLETLGTVENVVKAKFELIDRLPIGAAVVLNVDDRYLMAEAKRRNLKFVGFGIENECEFVARDISMSPDSGIVFSIGGRKITMPAFGRANVYNALAAIAASSVWGCGPEEWSQGLSMFRPISMRFEVEEYQGLHLVIDCYNANPASVIISLRSMNEIDAPGKKIAVLGDMLELGDASPDLHRMVGEEAARIDVDYLFCLGPQSKYIAEGAIAAGMGGDAVFHFDEHQNLLNRLLEVIAVGDLILCKGSRGMQMEKIMVGLKGAAFKNN
jgi:UDP-N-acetylmuramoyl-tripeptide--D-alanyl-D-alanine ligase